MVEDLLPFRPQLPGPRAPCRRPAAPSAPPPGQGQTRPSPYAAQDAPPRSTTKTAPLIHDTKTRPPTSPLVRPDPDRKTPGHAPRSDPRAARPDPDPAAAAPPSGPRPAAPSGPPAGATFPLPALHGLSLARHFSRHKLCGQKGASSSPKQADWTIQRLLSPFRMTITGHSRLQDGAASDLHAGGGHESIALTRGFLQMDPAHENPQAVKSVARTT